MSNESRIFCKAFSIPLIQVCVLAVVSVLVVPVEVVLLLGALLALLLLGALAVVVVPEVVVVPAVVLVLVVPVVVLPVVEVVLLVFVVHPWYVAVAPKRFKISDTRTSIVEHELVEVPVEEEVSLEVELPEPELVDVEPVPLHLV